MRHQPPIGWQQARGDWRAWFVMPEIDDERTCVAGEQPLIDRLATGHRLEAALTTLAAAADCAAEPGLTSTDKVKHSRLRRRTRP